MYHIPYNYLIMRQCLFLKKSLPIRMELLGSTVICINLFERVEKRTERTYMRAGYGG